jgi:hypothetical protein
MRRPPRGGFSLLNRGVHGVHHACPPYCNPAQLIANGYSADLGPRRAEWAPRLKATLKFADCTRRSLARLAVRRILAKVAKAKSWFKDITRGERLAATQLRCVGSITGRGADWRLWVLPSGASDAGIEAVNHERLRGRVEMPFPARCR